MATIDAKKMREMPQDVSTHRLNFGHGRGQFLFVDGHSARPCTLANHVRAARLAPQPASSWLRYAHYFPMQSCPISFFSCLHSLSPTSIRDDARRADVEQLRALPYRLATTTRHASKLLSY